MKYADPSGFAGAFTGSVSGAGARMAEALTYNAVCDLIGCPENKLLKWDIVKYSLDADAICEDALLGFCSYAANAAYSFKPAYNQGICTSDAAKAASEGGKNSETLYHYTNEKGMNGIVESNQLNPSLKANNPKDARYGNGQYLSDINQIL